MKTNDQNRTGTMPSHLQKQGVRCTKNITTASVSN